jgi:LPXTG-motif cell wall-anchored protein
VIVLRAARRTVLLTLLLATSTAVLLPATARAAVVSTLPGGTWSILDSTTDGGTATIVTGPGSPPAGDGSLKLTVASTADRALVGSDLGKLKARSWADLSAFFSTYVPADGSPSFAPSLRFAGFQQLVPSPAGFTTLSVEASRNGTVTPGQWQHWRLGPATVVWQSNATDGGFCIQSAPCTFAEFVARYPAGGWGEAQLGLGSGVAGPATGFVDAVTISDGPESAFTDFDPPAVSPSPSKTPTPVPSRTGVADKPTLPETGQPDVLWLSLIATALLMAGSGLILAARRRRTS